MQESYKIKNRKNQNIAVDVISSEKFKGESGLAFVMHGFAGHRKHPMIQAIAQAFVKKNFTTVLFDATNSAGESDGLIEESDPAGYYNDLEDVILWAKKHLSGKSQKILSATHGVYTEPFYIAGHSLGGMCAMQYAIKYPKKVKGIVLVSPAISGKLLSYKNICKNIFDCSGSAMRVVRKIKLPMKLIENLIYRLKNGLIEVDMLESAYKLKLPVLILVGEHDPITPPEHQKMLYEKLPAQKSSQNPVQKKLHIIKGARHLMARREHLDELKKIIGAWINA